MRNTFLRLLVTVACVSCVLLCNASGIVVEEDSVIRIPASVEEIPAYRYADRKDISRIEFADGGSLRKIGEYAFLGCVSLREIVIPEGVIELGEGCFRECCSLERIVFPNSLKKLPKAVCVWNETLKEVVLGDKTDDIGSHAFAYCSSLERFDFPSGLLHIGSNVFSRCCSLKEAVLPASVKELESYAFSDCVSLERAVMPANGSLLGELIFSGCESLICIEQHSPKVPKFDCESFAADPDDEAFYSRCVLYVPQEMSAGYSRASGWRLFRDIRGK